MIDRIGPAALPFERVRILMADDQPLIADLIRREIMRCFETCNPVVEVVSSLEAALHRYRANDGAFDLILLDAHMPGMGISGSAGLSKMLQVVKAGPGERAIPVAIISGSLKPDEAIRLLEQGAAGYIPKTGPVGVAEMNKAISVLLAGKNFRPGWLQEAEKIPAMRSTESQGAGRETLQEFLARNSKARMAAIGLMRGLTNDEIASSIGFGHTSSAKHHINKLFTMLGVKRRAAAALRLQALCPDLIDDDPHKPGHQHPV